MKFEVDILAVLTLLAAICITVGVYKAKFSQYDEKFNKIEEDFNKMEEKVDAQYEKAWKKIDKLTDAVYEVKNYIQLIASCFKMDIKDKKHLD